MNINPGPDQSTMINNIIRLDVSFRINEYTSTCCYTPASSLGYLASPGQFFMGVKLFIGTPLIRNKVILKIGMGYVKMHGFHGNPLYDSREWGLGL